MDFKQAMVRIFQGTAKSRVPKNLMIRAPILEILWTVRWNLISNARYELESKHLGKKREYKSTENISLAEENYWQ